MRPWMSSLLALSFCTAPVCAGSSGKVLLDTWDVAYLGDGKAGYIHTIAKEIDSDGKKVVHTTVELRLTVKRFNDTIQMSMDTGSIETGNGKVIGVFMKQFLGKQQQLQVDGTVSGDQVQLTLNGKTPLKPAPWNDEVLGLYKQQKLYKDRALRAGDKFTYLSFEPTINLVIKAEVAVKGYREVQLKGAKEKRKLLLVETVPEKVEFKRGPDKVEKIQLPASLTWLDDYL